MTIFMASPLLDEVTNITPGLAGYALRQLP
jgi:hypothetical protein